MHDEVGQLEQLEQLEQLDKANTGLGLRL